MDQAARELIILAYKWTAPDIAIVNSGLINKTLKVITGNKTYLLQSVNTHVFKHPEQIDENLNKLAHYLKQYHPNYYFTAPLKTTAGSSLIKAGDQYYRVFDWVENSHTVDVVASPHQAREAAKAFGLFTSLLQEFDASQLNITLPDFHNLSLRYQQFENALQNGNTMRMNAAKEEISYLQSKANIVKRYETFITHKEVSQRVTHHDTKISNVLFNDQDNSLCVIDLDTVMPGYFLSDVGDMFRTYICPYSEEEKDFDKLFIRKDYLQAIEQGYLQHMAGELSGFEKDHFYFAGEMLIYMQSLRFITDYLNNDSYYGSRYEGQNLVRGGNQARLLALFEETNGKL